MSLENIASSFLASSILVGRFNPFEKYARQIGFIFPKIGKKIKHI